MRSRLLVLCVLMLAGSAQTYAHPGGLDSKGCHTNRKTGEYHCHRAQTEPTAAQPIVSKTSPSASRGVVKLSKSGICHDSNSPWYGQTQNYTPFKSMNDCLAAGGRRPKGM